MFSKYDNIFIYKSRIN